MVIIRDVDCIRIRIMFLISKFVRVGFHMDQSEAIISGFPTLSSTNDHSQ